MKIFTRLRARLRGTIFAKGWRYMRQPIERREMTGKLKAALQAVRVSSFRSIGKSHGLPSGLIISLTSFPDRFNVVELTLRSLLLQTVAADRIILWIAEHDLKSVPEGLHSLSPKLEIRGCAEMRSYKKIIPALETFPDCFVVTADDDLYYEPGWLATIVGAYQADEHAVICRRAHRITFDKMSRLKSYADWEWEVITDGEPRGDLFPTSGAGALYPPGVFDPDVLDRAFLELAPTADDVWLYWMTKRADAMVRQVGGRFYQVTWPGSQAKTLSSVNVINGNVRQLTNVMKAFPLNRERSRD